MQYSFLTVGIDFDFQGGCAGRWKIFLFQLILIFRPVFSGGHPYIFLEEIAEIMGIVIAYFESNLSAFHVRSGEHVFCAA
jgi:hypothetical protein